MAEVRSGYDRRSLYALVTLVVVGSIVGYRWSDLIDVSGGMDWLLAGTWLAMAALLTWSVDVRHDLVLLAVAFGGGAVIEWWGTNTELWTYFTVERPPLWILPAWPIAALSIDRLAHFIDRLLGDRGSRAQFRAAYWLLMPSFFLAMVAFASPTIQMRATLTVVVLMVGIVVCESEPRRDVMMFLGGSLLGFFLEYWGTSRQCWVYYTHQVPPPVCVFAHGFAAVAFARGTALAERVLDVVGRAIAVRLRRA